VIRRLTEEATIPSQSERRNTGLVSKENVEIVQRCYELWDERDWAAITELLHQDFELDLSRNIFNPDIYLGRTGLEKYQSGVDDVWEGLRLMPTELIDAGANVVAAITIRAKGKGSGVEVEMQAFNVWTVDDSKVVRVVGGYLDRSEALAAVGLSEQAHSASS
jgi:ketosteroid isomerase-like protein